VVTGTNPIALTNGGNSWTGGTTVDGGFLALKATNANGQGDGPGQTCVGGAMDPSNLINLINGGTLSLDNAGALGNSPVLPQYAPTIHVNEGSKIYGGTNTIAFVSNITLDGGKIEATNGASVAGFNTNLCLVGTVIVGGVSTLPSQIITTGTGPNANVSLGSMGLPGTTFQVADVGVGSDLVVGSILTNVNVSVSSLTKSGPGTLELQASNTYTGPTHVVAGELRANIASFADGADVVVDTGATLNLQFASVDTISRLTLGGATMAPGIYGSVANATPGISHTPFITGSGMLYVTSAGSTDPYELWDDVIPNAADRDRTDDPDGDGFNNLQEYLFGTSPIANTGVLSTIERSGSNLIIRWSQRSPGTYVVQESATLMADSWGPSTVVPANAANQSGLYSADYVRKEAIIPIDSAKKFIRVKATE
jgi:autotransporter-associated beta strand protein